MIRLPTYTWGDISSFLYYALLFPLTPLKVPVDHRSSNNRHTPLRFTISSNEPNLDLDLEHSLTQTLKPLPSLPFTRPQSNAKRRKPPPPLTNRSHTVPPKQKAGGLTLLTDQTGTVPHSTKPLGNLARKPYVPPEKPQQRSAERLTLGAACDGTLCRT